MTRFSQHSLSLAHELRVQPENFERVGDLIDNSLSRPVSAGEQFKVFDTVILAAPVLVVDSFFGQQRSTDVVFHDPSVFEFGMLESCHEGRNGDISISVSGSGESLNAASLKSGKGCGSLAISLALPVAVLLFAVKVPVRPSLHGLNFSALLTGEIVSSVGGFLSANCGARDRTVFPIFTKLLSVKAIVGRLHGERRAAFLAYPMDHINASGKAAVSGFMGGLASSLTKNLSRMGWFHGKLVSALRAFFGNRHGVLLVGMRGHFTPELYSSK